MNEEVSECEKTFEIIRKRFGNDTFIDSMKYQLAMPKSAPGELEFFCQENLFNHILDTIIEIM